MGTASNATNFTGIMCIKILGDTCKHLLLQKLSSVCFLVSYDLFDQYIHHTAGTDLLQGPTSDA